ncbi:methionine permease [Malassezia nana]|uniref:Methionine permease n=1 Tax=Malassezia nana TaxID=180528 RepID=A0AAF0EFG2_9BASI|nr:methionine permease [Malassezia nana]
MSSDSESNCIGKGRVDIESHSGLPSPDYQQDPLSATESGGAHEDPPVEIHYDELPQGRQLGTISAIFLMVNRILGTGVFSTTSTILMQSGSVGMSLIYWVIGGIIAGCGFAVYAEFAMAMHRNGGELNYLQYVYRKPKYLVASMYAAQALLLGQAAGNANTAGQYFIRAGGGETNEWNSKGVGVAVIMGALIMHGTMLKWGLMFQNAIGTFKVVILFLIVFAGFAALAGHYKGPEVHNFSNAFEGSRNDIYGVSSCIYNAIWSYVGYSNLFYALGEVRNPALTMKIAGIVSLVTLTILYVLCQVAYFAAVPEDVIRGSKQIIAAEFFKHMFGERSAKALSVFVALSAVANVFAVIFAQGRLNQALGRDNIVPFSKVFASNRPFNTPLAGLAWHSIVTLILMLAPPQGDAYNFVLNLSSYPLNVVNFFVALGLCFTYLPDSSRFKLSWLRGWKPPFRATFPIVLFFTLVSLFLVIVPWIPPNNAKDAEYESIWYALAPAVAFGFFAAGALYWLVWYILLPRIFGYKVVESQTTLLDGTPVTVFDREPK